MTGPLMLELCFLREKTSSTLTSDCDVVPRQRQQLRLLLQLRRRMS